MSHRAFVLVISVLFFIFTTSHASAQVPMNQPHPDRGIWVAYPDSGSATITDFQKPHIKGVMSYAGWRTLLTGITGGGTNTAGTATFNWNSLNTKLDWTINQIGKKTVVEVTGGYCSDANPKLPPPNTGIAWPPVLYNRIAHNKTAESGRCHNLQFWDPLYFSYDPVTKTGSGYFYQYIKALADRLAQFDSTDNRPTQTDITFIRSMVMAADMENLPNDDTFGSHEWADYDPATNGRIYQVNLTDTIKYDYAKKVALAYQNELKRAYAAVSLTPPAAGISKMADNWKVYSHAQELVNNNIWIDDHNFSPNPEGWYWDHIPFSKNTSQTRNTSEAGYYDPEPIVVQANTWNVLSALHAGQEFLLVYGANLKDAAHAALQPKGPVFYTENMPMLEFANKYAGAYRNPATSPGAWIAFRGYYPEERWSGVVQHDRMWTNYDMLMTQYRPQDSVFLFGQPNLTYAAFKELVPVANGTTTQINNDIVDCDSRYPIRTNYPINDCDYIRSQKPTVATGVANQYTFPITDLGTVHYCGSNDFCTTPASATRSEPMIWARRTNKAVTGGMYMRFDLNDTFAQSLNGNAQIRVAYLDQGTGSWQLMRDNDVVIGTVTKTNSNIWKEQTFTVSGAVFNNTGTGGTDVALYNGGSSNDDDIFHMIEVTRTTATPTITNAPISPSPTPVPGDVNGDQEVTLTDLSILLSNFGKTGTRSEGNIAGNDNSINLTDLATLLANFGK